MRTDELNCLECVEEDELLGPSLKYKGRIRFSDVYQCPRCKEITIMDAPLNLEDLVK